jgi:hypothetical protein
MRYPIGSVPKSGRSASGLVVPRVNVVGHACIKHSGAVAALDTVRLPESGADSR